MDKINGNQSASCEPLVAHSLEAIPEQRQLAERGENGSASKGNTPKMNAGHDS